MSKPAPALKYALLEPFRGLAALWVFTFHYHFSESFQDTFPLLHTLCKRGYLGVPMFFVISGFCITGSARGALRKEEGWTAFLYRRARRIYPPYWCSILLVVGTPFLIAGLIFLKTGTYLPPSPERPSSAFLSYGWLDWFNVATLTRAFSAVPGSTDLASKFSSINAVYWTLAVEVQFYLCVALALRLRRYFYPALLALTAASLPFLFVFSGLARTGIFLPYWPMFALGILLYVILEKGYSPSRLLGRWSPLTGLVAGLVLTGLFTWLAAKGIRISFLKFAAGFALLLFAVEGLDRGFVRQLAASPHGLLRGALRLFPLLGAMSYSMYLIHGKVLVLAMYALRPLLGADSLVFDFAAVSATCALCYLFYLACERPFLLGKAALGRRPQPALPRPANSEAGLALLQEAESPAPA